MSPSKMALDGTYNTMIPIKSGSINIRNKDIYYRIPNILIPLYIKDDLRKILVAISSFSIENVFIDISDVKTVILKGLESLKQIVRTIKLRGVVIVLLGVPIQYESKLNSFLLETNIQSFKSFQNYINKEFPSNNKDFTILDKDLKGKKTKYNKIIDDHLFKKEIRTKLKKNQLAKFSHKIEIDFDKNENENLN